ncbi:hypothetical protein [Agromyces sp. ZXT2-6]|uniref:hypothetical protein n=1 Tax=Agromyces sp. ZXT2-6 TaxID=3461153 RepID=UPI00405533B3
MSADGPATRWARTARPSEIAHGIAELDRRAVSAAPGYAELVTRAVSGAVAEIRAARADRLAALAREDRGAAAEVGRSGLRKAAIVAGVLAASGAAALYFSRAAFDPVTVLPLAAALIVASTVLMALALLPLRRAAPPTTGVAAVAWSTVVLSLGPLAMGAVLGGVTAGNTPAYLAGLVALAGLSALAVATTRIALSASPERRARTEQRIEAFPEQVADAGRDSIRRAVEELRAAWSAVDPEVRARVENDLAEAHRVLDERGLGATARPELPGALTVMRTAVAVAPGLERTLDAV